MVERWRFGGSDGSVALGVVEVDDSAVVTGREKSAREVSFGVAVRRAVVRQDNMESSELSVL